MQAQTDRATLTAENDNPGGKTSTSIAMRDLVTLIAKAYVAERKGKDEA